jgi:hypothetical protein
MGSLIISLARYVPGSLDTGVDANTDSVRKFVDGRDLDAGFRILEFLLPLDLDCRDLVIILDLSDVEIDEDNPSQNQHRLKRVLCRIVKANNAVLLRVDGIEGGGIRCRFEGR